MSNLPVKIKKLNEKAVIPSYATDGSAGLDLTAISEKTFIEGAVNYIEYGTGLAMQIPKGFVGLIFPRSSISSNTTLVLANSVGVIDSDYTGEIKFRFKSLMLAANKKYSVGDRVGQILIVPYPKVDFEEVEELNVTARGDGGFGHSGK